MPRVRVSAVCLRGSRSEEPLPPVSLRLVTETITVRELIERSVAKQVETLARDCSEKLSASEKYFQLQYLSEAELLCRSMLGPKDSPAFFDTEHAILQALEGFRHHAFKIVVDGKAHTEIDERLRIHDGADISFIRVVPSVVH